MPPGAPPLRPGPLPGRHLRDRDSESRPARTPCSRGRCLGRTRSTRRLSPGPDAGSSTSSPRRPRGERSGEMRGQVAFTPAEGAGTPVGIVVDVLRATSTIAQALASGYEQVYCTAEIDAARALRERLGEGLLGGERSAVKIEGFDVGASPREFLGEPRERTVIFSTTNGTRAILETAARSKAVLLGGLLNL